MLVMELVSGDATVSAYLLMNTNSRVALLAGSLMFLLWCLVTLPSSGSDRIYAVTYRAPRLFYYPWTKCTDTSQETRQRKNSVLILTPMKNTANNLARYFDLLSSLSYPKNLISIGILVSDSNDGTLAAVRTYYDTDFGAKYSRVTLVQRNYTNLRVTYERRHDYYYQSYRRTIMAMSRNFLISMALDDEQWVLWLDADLEYYPEPLVQDLLNVHADVVAPNCLSVQDADTYDRNFWQNTEKSETLLSKLADNQLVFEGYSEATTGRKQLSDMINQDRVQLNGVGGTVLLVRADLHRDGVLFPSVPYNHCLETEGFAQIAVRSKLEFLTNTVRRLHWAYKLWVFRIMSSIISLHFVGK